MRGLLALLLALAAASPGAAQRVPLPSKDSDFELRKKEGAKDTRRVMQFFANCMVRPSMSSVADYLDRPVGPFTPALRSRAPHCLIESYDDDGDMAMLKGDALAYRYALAEAWLVRKYGDAGPGDVGAIAAPRFSPASGENFGLNALAECVIHRDSSGSWALLTTEAASPEEKAMFQRLAPSMQACVREGSTLKMQAFFVRGAIAETYYLMTKAPRVPGAIR